MRRILVPAVALFCGAVLLGTKAAQPSYIFVWAGDSAGKASDFLAVVNADPSSSKYGEVVASVPTGAAGAHPHHTEGEMSAIISSR